MRRAPEVGPSRGAGDAIGAVLAASAVVIVVAAAVVCIAGVARGVVSGGAGASVWMEARAWMPGPVMVLRTVAVPVGIGIVATLLALPCAWALRGMGRWAAALLVCPLLLPNYVIYASLSGLRGAGTPIGDWIMTGPPWAVPVVNHAQAIVGLSLWAWPMGVLVLWPGVRAIGQERIDAARCAAVSRWRMAWSVVSALRGSVAQSVLVIGLVMAGSAVPLHVAQVETWSIGLWRGLFESDGGRAGVWVAAAVWSVLLAAGGVLLARWVGRGSGEGDHGGEAGAPLRASSGVMWVAAAIWAASYVGPMVVVTVQLREGASIVRHMGDLGPPMVRSLGPAAVAGLVVGLIGAAVGAMWARRAARAVCAALLVGAVAPGILIGYAVLSAGRLDGLQWLNRGSAGLVTSYVVRFGVVGAVLGVWVARAEPRELWSWRVMTRGRGAAGWAMSWGRGHIVALCGVVAGVMLLALHEIEASAVTAPIGGRTLAMYLLDLLHYLRDEELRVATLVLMGGGGVVALAAVLLVWKRPRGARVVSAAVLALCAVVAGGCERDPGEATRIDADLVFGGVGREDGQLLFPRAVDARDGELWICDKSARVQRFDAEGKFEAKWTMPAFESGMPVGMTVGPDGLIYMADTHQQRVSVFRPTAGGGELVATFGEYGTGPGQFIYPTDVVLVEGDTPGSVSRIYVSEYGGNDRVSVFDADGYRFLFSFGKEGRSESAASIEFARPQSMLLHPGLGELFITDSVNHRVGRFTLGGGLVAWYGGGEGGGGAGEYRYPYGLAVLPDGDVLVCEMGNNRVQRIDPRTGEGVGMYGVPGREQGMLKTPWGVAVLGWDVYVLDSGNHRVQRMRLEPRGSLLGW